MFKEGDIVQIVNFSDHTPNSSTKLKNDHPYRLLGEGPCKVRYTTNNNRIHVQNLRNGIKNCIYTWMGDVSE